MLGKKSNECTWNGQRVVIHSGHRKTTSVGVLYHMTSRLDAVLGAFQDETGSYRVMRLPIERCIPIMEAKPTQSHGASAGRVGKIPRQVFEEHGQFGEGCDDRGTASRITARRTCPATSRFRSKK